MRKCFEAGRKWFSFGVEVLRFRYAKIPKKNRSSRTCDDVLRRTFGWRMYGA